MTASVVVHLMVGILLWKDFERDFEGTVGRFRNHVKNVDKEAGLSNMIEASNERALVKADREEAGRKRKGNMYILLTAPFIAYD